MPAPETGRPGRPSIRGRSHMISAVHYLAAMGGLKLLEHGGNAIDAGVAAGLCINVLQPHYAMFGGVAPIVISLAGGPVVTISGLGRWPRAASLEDYLSRYGGDLPGGLARTVTPAAPDAWLTALAECGTLTLAEALGPAHDLAQEGFPLHSELQSHLVRAAAPEGADGRCASTAAAYLPEGRVPQVGEVFRQPHLAATFRRLNKAQPLAARNRKKCIYAAWNLANGGKWAANYFAFHQGHGQSCLPWRTWFNSGGGSNPPNHHPFAVSTFYSCGAGCQGPLYYICR